MLAYISRTARRLMMVAAVAAVTVNTTACGDDDSTGPDVQSSFQLQSINDTPLPMTLIDNPDLGVTVEVLSGRLELLSNDTYKATLRVRVTSDEGVETENIVETGRYTRQGSTYEFDPKDPELNSFSGVIAGGELTVEDDIGTGEIVTMKLSKR